MKKILFLFTVLIGLAIGFLYFITSVNLVDSEDGIELKIRSGDKWEVVQNQLAASPHLKHSAILFFVAKQMKYPERVRAGRYILKPEKSAIDIVRKLRNGQQDAVIVVINNITFVEDLASKISQQLDIDSVEFVQFMKDSQNAHQYGFSEEGFIGMFLCNTYEMYWNTSIEKFADRMQVEYNRFWNEERTLKANRQGITPEQAIILASIVQRETNYKPEYGQVASVYLNRLRKGMLLQADPTVKFALNDFAIKRILNKDLEIDSPYNTYKYLGLPPGPIGLPELNVVDAVLNSTSSDYLYFCAVYGTGQHAFSKTYSEHLTHARAYHRALSAQKIYR